MESNNYEWFISQTVEAMLPRFSDRNIGLGMILSMHWHHYFDDDTDIELDEPIAFKREYLLIFHRPHNYTKVFLRDITDDKFFGMENKEFDMILESDHDSCWRSDGLRFIFKTFVDAWEYFDTKGVEGRQVDPLVHWSIFQGKPAYYEMTYQRMTDEQWGKQPYKVLVGDKIPLNKISEYMPKD